MVEGFEGECAAKLGKKAGGEKMVWDTGICGECDEHVGMEEDKDKTLTNKLALSLQGRANQARCLESDNTYHQSPGSIMQVPGDGVLGTVFKCKISIQTVA